MLKGFFDVQAASCAPHGALALLSIGRKLHLTSFLWPVETIDLDQDPNHSKARTLLIVPPRLASYRACTHEELSTQHHTKESLILKDSFMIKIYVDYYKKLWLALWLNIAVIFKKYFKTKSFQWIECCMSVFELIENPEILLTEASNGRLPIPTSKNVWCLNEIW